MKPFLYFFQCALRNRIQHIIRKPLILLGYVVFVIFMLINVISLNRIDNEPVEEVYIAITTIITIGVILIHFLLRIHSQSFNFEPADINLLFTSPISPGRMLFFRKIRNSALPTFFFYSFVSFVPLLNMSLGTTDGFLITYISFIFLKLTCVLLGVIWHAIIGRKNPLVKKTLTIGILSIVILYSIWACLPAIRSDNPIKEVVYALNADYISYIPIIGWLRHLFLSAVYGFGWDFIVSFALMSIFLGLVSWYILTCLEYSYTEDLYVDTNKSEIAKRTNENGKESKQSLYGNSEKSNQVSFKFTKTGAGAIFQKHMLEYKKCGFHFLTKRTIIYPLIVNAAVLFILFNGIIGNEMILALGVAIFLAMLLTPLSACSGEVFRHYIYLIPDNSFKKLYLSTIIDMLKSLIDGAFIFFVTAIFFGLSLFGALLCALIYCLFIVMFYYMDIISFFLFGELYHIPLRAFLRLLFFFLIVIPAVSIVITMLYLGFSPIVILVVLLLSHVILAFLLSIPAAMALNNPEIS